MQPRKAPSAFHLKIQAALRWIETHREQFWSAAALVFLAGLFAFFIVRHHQTENEEAWNQLGAVQGQLTENETEAARKSLSAWEPRFADSSAATYAQFLKADLLYKTSDYAQAAQVYGQLAQSARPLDLRPLALSAQSSSEEMAGHYPQAYALAQSFTNQYPDHYLAAPMYLAQARLAELTGNPSAASAVYDRFVILFPQSPWTDLARSRQQALAGSKPPLPK